MTKLEHFLRDYQQGIRRRWFFKQCGMGLGSMALASLLENELAPGAPVLPDETCGPAGAATITSGQRGGSPLPERWIGLLGGVSRCAAEP